MKCAQTNQKNYCGKIGQEHVKARFYNHEWKTPPFDPALYPVAKGREDYKPQGKRKKKTSSLDINRVAFESEGEWIV